MRAAGESHLKYLSQAQLGDCVLINLNNPHFQGSIDDMKAEAETMIAAAKVEGEQIKRKGAEQVCYSISYLISGNFTPKPYFVQTPAYY